MPSLKLAYNLSFDDIYSISGLQYLDKLFLQFLDDGTINDQQLKQQLIEYREAYASINQPKYDKKIANFILQLAPHLEDFIAQLFNIQGQIQQLRFTHNYIAPLYSMKRLFVQRKSKIYNQEIENFNGDELKNQLLSFIDNINIEQLATIKLSPDVIKNLQNNQQLFFELRLSLAISIWQQEENLYKQQIDTTLKYSAWGLNYFKEKNNYAGILFKQAHKLDFNNLVQGLQTSTKDNNQFQHIDTSQLHQRISNTKNAFSLTDEGYNLFEGLDESHYCIHCHNQDKDSCSKGLREKTTNENNIEYKKSIFGVNLAGCPLEEKISEFNSAKTQGLPLAALAIMCIDNPMVAATGHRICNDCMKSCIYQKQTPVDIPQAETQTVKQILNLPWGFEIYSLLTRWNPLNLQQPYPKDYSNKNVLIVGMGPAGYTLAHYLLNEGHTVVGIDGLKIEPLQQEFKPIYDVNTLFVDLDKRNASGFGGVSEYGITVRWNKNFLTIIRLILERRTNFALIGGVRFGGNNATLDQNSAFELGFDHIALAMGAGKPTVLDIPNCLAKGVRTASDFLMNLQLGGAGKSNSLTNLQIRLPAIVIGGGLTAIDTATESMSYYTVQVEKFASRYEELLKNSTQEEIQSTWSDEEKEIATEFLQHAQAIRQEKQLAKIKNRAPKIAQLIQSWGGVSVLYRKALTQSPAYTLNHEEVQKALEEGIFFIENSQPTRVNINQFGHITSLDVINVINKTTNTLLAKSLFIAAGTSPNTVISKEDSITYKLDDKYFQAIDEEGNNIKPQYGLAKPQQVYVLLHKTENNKFISFFGDLHPSYFGNIVKAMASAKQGYPTISKVLHKISKNKLEINYNSIEFLNKITNLLSARVHKIIRLTPNIIEIIIHAPLAASNFKPGQFYRLQNFDAFASTINIADYQTQLSMESLALTGAWVNKEKGLIGCIALEMGSSSNLCANLKIHEPVILMGPTGTPTHITSNENIILVGGGLGNAVLFSIGAAFRSAGSKVLYFAGYKKKIDRYKIEEIEQAADTIIWCCDEDLLEINPNRPQDRTFHGNIVQAILNYANGNLGTISINTKNVHRMIVIGSDKMMAAVAYARHNILQSYLNPHHLAIGSINSPMQCMMKEICAQCLQAHIKPDGSIEYVFSCLNQDQNLDEVDFKHLEQRLGQNSLQEKISNQWLTLNCHKNKQISKNIT